MSKNKKNIFKTLIVLMALFLAACQEESADSSNTSGNSHEKIERFTGEESKAIPSVYTTQKALSLTFNGMGDGETMEKLLDELDKYHIKATFFLPGMRVAEEPEIAKEIIARGHEIENNTLNQLDMSDFSYEQIYKEIKLSNDIIQKETGVSPRYVRTKTGDYKEDVRLATAQLGMDVVVSYNINPKDWKMKDAKSIASYVERYIARGSIINLNTNFNPEVITAIPFIAKAVSDMGYKLIPLEDLIANGKERKPLAQIPGHDAASVDFKNKNPKYKLIYNLDTTSPKIALTFDDWGSEKTVNKILDILKEASVKATFFLRARGVQDNPNLARALVEEGHDVANHTYTHPVLTTITPEKLQNEVVTAHKVITEAIQQQPVMFFRPPTGEIDEQSAKNVAATGYSDIIMYDVTVLDWDKKNSATDIVNGLLKKTHNGSIILLHMLDDIHTIEALPLAIKKLKDKGYKFVLVSDLIKSKS